MKILLRIPTVQYGYMDVEFEGTPEGAIEEHNRILNLYNGGFGLDQKAWNTAIDRYLEKGDVDDTYNEMSTEQMRVIQEIKKSLKRIDYKTNTN